MGSSNSTMTMTRLIIFGLAAALTLEGIKASSKDHPKATRKRAVNNRLRNAANVADRRNPASPDQAPVLPSPVPSLARNPITGAMYTPVLIQTAMLLCENPNCLEFRESYGAGYRCWKCGHVPVQTVPGPHGGSAGPPPRPPVYDDTSGSPLISPASLPWVSACF